MANIKDVNVNIRKRFSDNTTLNLYPNTKSSNIKNSDGTTVDEFIEKQELKNNTFNSMKEKLDSVEYGAKKNQNAFSTVSISGRKVITSNKEKSDINIIPGDNIDISDAQGSLKISVNSYSITQLATDTENGMMSSADFKKLKGIDDGANKYIHPKSTTSGSFTSVTTDEYGHVVSGDTNPLPIAKGGTGVDTIDAIKEELSVPLPTVDRIDGLTPNAVSSKTVFKALEGKADKEHGNHVPDSPSSPDPQHFLAEGNAWKSLPKASNTTLGVTTIEDTIKYNEENDANNNISSASAVTVRAVYNFLIQKETELVDGATSYTTFKSIEDYINAHTKEFEDLNANLGAGDSNTLKSAKEYVDSEITKLITGTNDNSVIDTFKEVQTWVGNHEELYNNLLKAVALKAEKVYVDTELGKKVDSSAYTDSMNKLTSDIATKLNEKVDKIAGKGLSTNDLTNDLVDKINNAYTHIMQSHAPSDAEKNKIVSVSKNGVKIDPDISRNVNIVVPMKISELENDSKYLTSHPDISKANDTKSTKTVDTTIDDTFTVIDTVSRDVNGHLTAINTKTIKIPKRETVDIKTLKVGNNDSNVLSYDGSVNQKITITQGDNVTVSFDKATGVFTISSAMYTHPTSSGNKHIPAGGSSGQILRWSADGTAKWDVDNDTQYDVFTGCSVATDGSSGLVPKPNKTDVKKFLSSEGTWEMPEITHYDLATEDKSGLMSSSDFTKLSGIDAGANKTVIDTALSSTSTNPIQNKIVKSAIDRIDTALASKAASNHAHTKSDIGLGNVDNTADANKTVKNANAITGFTVVDRSSPSWGEFAQTAYKTITEWKSTTEGGIAFADKDNTTSIQIDGYFYQNEGTYKVLDTNNFSDVAAKKDHTHTKSDIGLGNVGNFKAVSTAASQGLSTTEKSNARANIGAGTSSFSGSYTDLTNKPTIPTNTNQLTNGSGFITMNNLASATDNNVNFKTVGVGEAYYIAGHNIYEVYSAVLILNSAAGVNYNSSKLFKVGNLVMLKLDFTATFSGNDMTFASIPTGYRPLTTITHNFVTNNGNHRYIRALPEGQLTIIGQHISGDGARLVLFWFTED